MEGHLYTLGYLQKFLHFDSEICTEYQVFRYNFLYDFDTCIYMCKSLNNNNTCMPYYLHLITFNDRGSICEMLLG